MKLFLDHVDPHYGAYFTTAFRNRARKDGGRFLEGLKEAEGAPPIGKGDDEMV